MVMMMMIMVDGVVGGIVIGTWDRARAVAIISVLSWR